MKTSKVELATWHSIDPVINIDWPRIQKLLGLGQLEWLLKQPKTKCQLVVEQANDNFKLVAEFYDDTVLTCYHLMWAK